MWSRRAGRPCRVSGEAAGTSRANRPSPRYGLVMRRRAPCHRHQSTSLGFPPEGQRLRPRRIDRDEKSCRAKIPRPSPIPVLRLRSRLVTLEPRTLASLPSSQPSPAPGLGWRP
ncbi:hypothetical protein VTK73DRAFT_3932 [Phialemonium thermophilum]|uniref:Uncharacterized protein n=1 Tax=Phialemonium thermophilum TaxID=223376 RepID=A0ABR3VDB2_9PEZI